MYVNYVSPFEITLPKEVSAQSAASQIAALAEKQGFVLGKPDTIISSIKNMKFEISASASRLAGWNMSLESARQRLTNAASTANRLWHLISTDVHADTDYSDEVGAGAGHLSALATRLNDKSLPSDREGWMDLIGSDTAFTFFEAASTKNEGPYAARLAPATLSPRQEGIGKRGEGVQNPTTPLTSTLSPLPLNSAARLAMTRSQFTTALLSIGGIAALVWYFQNSIPWKFGSNTAPIDLSKLEINDSRSLSPFPGPTDPSGRDYNLPLSSAVVVNANTIISIFYDGPENPIAYPGRKPYDPGEVNLAFNLKEPVRAEYKGVPYDAYSVRIPGKIYASEKRIEFRVIDGALVDFNKAQGFQLLSTPADYPDVSSNESAVTRYQLSREPIQRGLSVDKISWQLWFEGQRKPILIIKGISFGARLADGNWKRYLAAALVGALPVGLFVDWYKNSQIQTIQQALNQSQQDTAFFKDTLATIASPDPAEFEPKLSTLRSYFKAHPEDFSLTVYQWGVYVKVGELPTIFDALKIDKKDIVIELSYYDPQDGRTVHATLTESGLSAPGNDKREASILAAVFESRSRMMVDGPITVKLRFRQPVLQGNPANSTKYPTPMLSPDILQFQIPVRTEQDIQRFNLKGSQVAPRTFYGDGKWEYNLGARLADTGKILFMGPLKEMEGVVNQRIQSMDMTMDDLRDPVAEENGTRLERLRKTINAYRLSPDTMIEIAEYSAWSKWSSQSRFNDGELKFYFRVVTPLAEVKVSPENQRRIMEIFYDKLIKDVRRRDQNQPDFTPSQAIDDIMALLQNIKTSSGEGHRNQPSTAQAWNLGFGFRFQTINDIHANPDAALEKVRQVITGHPLIVQRYEDSFAELKRIVDASFAAAARLADLTKTDALQILRTKVAQAVANPGINHEMSDAMETYSWHLKNVSEPFGRMVETLEGLDETNQAFPKTKDDWQAFIGTHIPSGASDVFRIFSNYAFPDHQEFFSIAEQKGVQHFEHGYQAHYGGVQYPDIFSARAMHDRRFLVALGTKNDFKVQDLEHDRRPTQYSARVVIYDANAEKIVAELPLSEGQLEIEPNDADVQTLSFSEEGNTLTATTANGRMIRWNIQNLNDIKRVEGARLAKGTQAFDAMSFAKSLLNASWSARHLDGSIQRDVYPMITPLSPKQRAAVATVLKRAYRSLPEGPDKTNHEYSLRDLENAPNSAARLSAADAAAKGEGPRANGNEKLPYALRPAASAGDKVANAARLAITPTDLTFSSAADLIAGLDKLREAGSLKPNFKAVPFLDETSGAEGVIGDSGYNVHVSMGSDLSKSRLVDSRNPQSVLDALQAIGALSEVSAARLAEVTVDDKPRGDLLSLFPNLQFTQREVLIDDLLRKLGVLPESVESVTAVSPMGSPSVYRPSSQGSFGDQTVGIYSQRIDIVSAARPTSEWDMSLDDAVHRLANAAAAAAETWQAAIDGKYTERIFSQKSERAVELLRDLAKQLSADTLPTDEAGWSELIGDSTAFDYFRMASTVSLQPSASNPAARLSASAKPTQVNGKRGTVNGNTSPLPLPISLSPGDEVASAARLATTSVAGQMVRVEGGAPTAVSLGLTDTAALESLLIGLVSQGARLPDNYFPYTIVVDPAFLKAEKVGRGARLSAQGIGVVARIKDLGAAQADRQTLQKTTGNASSSVKEASRELIALNNLWQIFTADPALLAEVKDGPAAIHLTWTPFEHMKITNIEDAQEWTAFEAQVESMLTGAVDLWRSQMVRRARPDLEIYISGLERFDVPGNETLYRKKMIIEATFKDWSAKEGLSFLKSGSPERISGIISRAVDAAAQANVHEDGQSVHLAASELSLDSVGGWGAYLRALFVAGAIYTQNFDASTGKIDRTRPVTGSVLFEKFYDIVSGHLDADARLTSKAHLDKAMQGDKRYVFGIRWRLPIAAKVLWDVVVQTARMMAKQVGVAA